MRFKQIIILVGISWILAGRSERAIAQAEAFMPLEPFIQVENIEIRGNTLFPDSELEALVAPLERKKVSISELLRLRSEITQYYVDRGYTSSGAFLPPQKYTDGDVEIQIVEGVLETIEIKGLSSLSESYIRNKLPELGKPLNTTNLAQSLEKIQRHPLIKRVTAELVEKSIGKNSLLLELDESSPWKSELRFSNGFSPSVGSFGGTVNFNHQSLLGFSDRLSANWTRTEGLSQYRIGYSFPFNNLDGTISFDYVNADSELVEDAVSPLDIQAEYESFGILLRQPIYSDANSELALSMEFERLTSETFVFEDLSYPFVEGLEDGQSKITAWRLAQEYSTRSSSSVLDLKSQFNIGTNIFEVTQTEVGIDGLFWSWQGQAQWLLAFNRENDALVATRLSAQFSPDKLLPLEQFSVGGAGSVRGYRQNVLVGDLGYAGTIEVQLPLIRTQGWGKIILSPFFDWGTISNNDRETPKTNTLASVGLGLGYKLEDAFEFRIDYGFPLIALEELEASTVEDRLTFSLIIRPLNF